MDRRTFLEMTTGIAGATMLTGQTLAESAGSPAHEGFEPHGSVDIQGAKEAIVHHDNEVAYVAVGNGFVAVDITDPAEPTIMAERRGIESESGPIRQMWDLQAWEDRLVVAGPAQGGRQSGFALFDISDPSAPDQVALYETDHGIHNCYLDDGMVYLTGTGLRTNPLVIVDVTDDEPEERSRWSLIDADDSYSTVPPALWPLHDVYVQDDIAYLSYWEAGAWLVDVSDPANPTALSHVGEYDQEELLELNFRDYVTPPGNAHYAQVNEDGTLLAVGAEAWSTDGADGIIGGAGGVDLYDISDKSNPSYRSTIEAPASYSQKRGGWFTTAHNLDFSGNRMYTSWYYGGVKIHDVSDPANPVELAWWRDPNEAAFWTAQSAGDMFVASSLDTSILVSDPPSQTREALYLFEDTPARQENPPSLEQPPADVTIEDDGGTGSENETAGGERVDSEQTTGENSTEGADESGAGFGAGVALAGLGSASYYLARKRGDEEFSE